MSDASSVDVLLEEELKEGTSYTLTVLAAISVGGSTIVDGAEALKEFVTPSPLKKKVVDLSAPPNPNAVIVEESNEPEPTEVKTTPVREPVKVTVVPEPTPTEELPLTGMNPAFFLLLILPVVYFFLRRRPL
jgi:hypothetical protein